MVERPRLELRLCDYQSHVLTIYTIPLWCPDQESDLELNITIVLLYHLTKGAYRAFVRLHAGTSSLTGSPQTSEGIVI